MSSMLLSELVPSVTALSDREAERVFDAWWARWRPVYAMAIANTARMSATFIALPLLDGEWRELTRDDVVTLKVAVRELSFRQREDPDCIDPEWTAVSDVALGSTELVKALFVARREGSHRSALRAIVSNLGYTMSGVAWAVYTVTLHIDVEDIHDVVGEHEQPEAQWFLSVIRAALLRQDTRAFAAAPVTVAPAVRALLFVRPDALRV